MSNPDIALSGTWANTFVLKHSPNPSWDSGSTYAYYGLWNIVYNTWNDSTTAGESSHIKVHTTTNEWSDHGGDHPGSNVSRSGETITLRNQGGSVKATFTRPSSSTWGGTSTSGPPSPAGTIQHSQNQLIFKVLSTSPSASGVVVYELYKDGVLTSMNFTGHTHGQTTSRFASANDGLWVLKIVSSTGLYQSEDLASLTLGGKKVHCNFW